jgi:hypothetical protein
MTGNDSMRPSTLVWIDAREAVIVSFRDDEILAERMESEVPEHHRATGHVRHDPAIRHGGGAPQTAGEPRRLEYLKRFITGVADRLAPDDDLVIMGPGTVHERLARQVAASDRRHGRRRDIVSEASRQLTDRQLDARLRVFAGAKTRRRTLGAYRWVESPGRLASGKAQCPPRRVVEKRPRERGPEAP